MAAAECIPVNISNADAEEIKKLNGAGDHAEANGCHKNGKECATEEAAPETTTDNSNTGSTEQSEKTETPGNTGDEEVCEEEPAVGSEEIGEYDERMNGHSKESEECCDEEEDDEDEDDAEDGCDEGDEGVATKRCADEGECIDEPSKKLCPETEDAQNAE